MLGSSLVYMLRAPYKDREETKQIEYLEAKTEFLEQELLKWNDHSTRMKRILGIPDTTSITYLEKIKHPINLRALEQWKIERRD